MARLDFQLDHGRVVDAHLRDVDPMVASVSALLDEFVAELDWEAEQGLTRDDQTNPRVGATRWSATLTLGIDGGLSRSFGRQETGDDPDTTGPRLFEALRGFLLDGDTRDLLARNCGILDRAVPERRQPSTPPDPTDVALDRDLWHIRPSGVRRPRGLVGLAVSQPDSWVYSPLTTLDQASRARHDAGVQVGVGLDGLATTGVEVVSSLFGQVASRFRRPSGQDWIWASVRHASSVPHLVLLSHPSLTAPQVATLMLWNRGQIGTVTSEDLTDLVVVAGHHRAACVAAGFVATIANVHDQGFRQTLLASGAFFRLEDVIAAWGLTPT